MKDWLTQLFHSISITYNFLALDIYEHFYLVVSWAIKDIKEIFHWGIIYYIYYLIGH